MKETLKDKKKRAEIIVDLFRRWCKVEYPTIDLALTSMLKNN